MSLILWTVISVIAIVLDQVSKSIVVKKLMPIGSHKFIEGFMDFRYTENTGAAFGMMKGFRWGFIILSSLAIIAIIVCLVKYRNKVSPLLGIALSMIVGGGIGNQIDRIANGYVVDFLEFQFIDFAIFNIADSFVTVGAVLIFIDLLFFDRNILFEGDKTSESAVPEKKPSVEENHND